MINNTSSPFGSSPLTKTSPRLFWQGRDSGENRNPYDPEAVISPKRRSIENLKRASRVKNSSMFAREQKQEYDPADVRVLQRPLANRRPYSMVEQSKRDSSQESARPDNEQPTPENNAPTQQDAPQPRPSSRDQPSPPKSSLSKASRFSKFDPQSDIWADFDDSQGGPRHAKSVTFDAAPPQINEYEMTTPDPSSIASESRDGSYDSEEEEEFGESSFDCGSSLDHEDSFDASLEDTEKTPVVLPEDWRFMSPHGADDELVHEEDDPFTEDNVGSPGLDVRPSSQHGPNADHARVESLDSNGERRPLPPLPSSRGVSSGRLSAALERASSAPRSLPVPPGPASYSKEDISDIGGESMTLEDRLRLMMLDEHDDEPHQRGEEEEEEAEKERENGNIGAPEQENSHENEADDKPTDSQHTQRGASPGDDQPSPPRISRESILRNIKNQDFSSEDDDYEYSSQTASSPYRPLPLDPDVPIPSLEDDNDDTGSVIIKEEESDDENLYGVPEYYPQQNHQHSSFTSDELTSADDDDGSKYSRPSHDEVNVQRHESAASEDGQATPVPPTRHDETADKPSAGDSRELSELPDAPGLDKTATRESLQRSGTPGAGGEDEPEEPSTPESVIRHPVPDDVSDEESIPDESIPDQIATVKAPGSGLRARPSLTPLDTESMAATRRQVSGQQARMPSLSKQLTNTSHRSQHDDVPEESEEANQEEEDDEDEGQQQEDEDEEEEEEDGDGPPHRFAPPEVSQRQSSLVKLEIPVSSQEESLFGLDKEFDHIIEAQKVAFQHSLSQSTLSCTREFTQDGPTPGTQANYPKTQGVTPARGAIANRNIPRQRGYLMRQNTKVIVASSHSDESQPSNESDKTDNNEAKPISGTRKISQPTWTTVPWNSQMRRQSIKVSSPKRKAAEGPVPPLPGQSSAVQDAAPSAEDNETASTHEVFEEGEERGRLFVKVIGVKDLDLPLPRGKLTSVDDLIASLTSTR